MKRLGVSVLAVVITTTVTVRANELEDSISSLMRKYEAVGLSVAVVKGNNIIYTHAFGYKDLENSIPLRTDDLFRIASVSKTLTATGIMQLVERGKLSLDDDINKYLGFKVQNPKYPHSVITIKMLLCHRSSINDSQGYKSFEKIVKASEGLSIKCFSDFEPGSEYKYCNLNYNLLGAIIENVTGKRFDKYINRSIIKPLRLHGSFNVLDLDSALFVKAYRFNNRNKVFSLSVDTYLPHKVKLDNYQLGFTIPYLSPAGGLKITAAELAEYMMMHMNHGTYKKKRIISPASVELMREVPVERHWYALSFTRYNNSVIPNEKMVGQTGGAYGIHTAMIFHPKKNYGFVVFCNGCKSKSMNGQEMNFEIIRLLYDRLVL